MKDKKCETTRMTYEYECIRESASEKSDRVRKRKDEKREKERVCYVCKRERG